MNLASGEDPVKAEMRAKLEKEFRSMMSALYKEEGAQLRIEILQEPGAMGFIQAHADILDSSFETTEMSDTLRQNLQDSDWMFSGMKTFHELNEAFPSLLDDKGNRKPFEQFLNDVQRIDNTYNRNYLRAEYNFAQGAAEMAARWEQFEEDGDRYLLQYRTVNDGLVRPEHAALHGVTLPKDDSFWNTYYPPNGWNCRCTVVQVSRSTSQVTSHEEAMSRAGEALPDKKVRQMFGFNSGKERRTFPAYNPYTISKCATCDKAKLSLAFIPDNQVCQRCQLFQADINARQIETNRAEYERLKADKNFKNVEFNEETGAIKATHISHKTKNPKMKRYFGEEGLTGLDLEKECQDEIFNNGGKCILLSEGEKNAVGNSRPALDSMSFGNMMDIRSITDYSQSYRNAISDKNDQLHRYNSDHESNMDSLCLYFHDPNMYDPNKVIKGYKKQYIQGNKTTENIIKHIYCVVRGNGIHKFDF